MRISDWSSDVCSSDLDVDVFHDLLNSGGHLGILRWQVRNKRSRQAPLHDAREAEDRREGSAQFVADVGKEHGFRSIGPLRMLPCLLQQFLAVPQIPRQDRKSTRRNSSN